MESIEKKTRALAYCRRCTSSRVQMVPDSVLAAGSQVECGVCHGPAYVTRFDPKMSDPERHAVTDMLRTDVEGAALTIMHRVVDPLLGQVPIVLDRDAAREELRTEIAALVFERVGEHAHHHHRVAKSRRAWINAATAHLGPEWSGTPEELQAELAALVRRAHEANAMLAEARCSYEALLTRIDALVGVP
jgi:hypothetical protein